ASHRLRPGGCALRARTYHRMGRPMPIPLRAHRRQRRNPVEPRYEETGQSRQPLGISLGSSVENASCLEILRVREGPGCPPRARCTAAAGPWALIRSLAVVATRAAPAARNAMATEIC